MPCLRRWGLSDRIVERYVSEQHVPDINVGNISNRTPQPIRFEDAPRESMGKCTVASSEQELGIASKHSMSPYFKIIAPDVVDEI